MVKAWINSAQSSAMHVNERLVAKEKGLKDSPQDPAGSMSFT